jgi:hypothetical protein
MFKRLVETTDNPYRIEMVKHLTLVFFYLSGYRLHQLPEPETVSPHKRLAEKFLILCQTITGSSDRWVFIPKN